MVINMFVLNKTAIQCITCYQKWIINISVTESMQWSTRQIWQSKQFYIEPLMQKKYFKEKFGNEKNINRLLLITLSTTV